MDTRGPTVPAHDPQLGGRLRGILVCFPAIAYTFVWSIVVLILLSCFPRWSATRWWGWLHRWGRFMLWLTGLRLETHGLERIAASSPCLVMFNHQSLLDLVILATTWPAGATVLYKREFHRIPFMGRAMRRAGMIPIDRSHQDAARESLAEAASEVREHGRVVLIAPEGTRSRRGGLQDFKLGPFHLACATGVPILPFIVRGVAEVLPMGRFGPHTGTIRVDVPAPIDTTGWDATSVRDHAADVRDVFLAWLPPAAGSATSGNAA